MSKTIPPVGAVPAKTAGEWRRLDSSVKSDRIKEDQLLENSTVFVQTLDAGYVVVIDYNGGDPISKEDRAYAGAKIELRTNKSTPVKFVRVCFFPSEAPMSPDPALPPTTAGDDSGNSPRAV